MFDIQSAHFATNSRLKKDLSLLLKSVPNLDNCDSVMLISKVLLIAIMVVGYQMQECSIVSNSQTVILDMRPPINAILSAAYKQSFAYYTVKNRLPVILTQTIDGLVRHKDEIEVKYGTQGSEELKQVIGNLSELKYEVQTDKPLRLLTSNATDTQFYNDYISRQDKRTYYSAIWLLAECYMYRRIWESFQTTSLLKEYDPYQQQKIDAFENSKPLIQKVAYHLLSLQVSQNRFRKADFRHLLRINLWGNKCDLAIAHGGDNAKSVEIFNVNDLEPNILSDDTTIVYEALRQKKSHTIDIVFDNAGYELFTDLCLADYLLNTGVAQKVRFYVKKIPWFVSDVTISDLAWTLQQLEDSPVDALRMLGEKWSSNLLSKAWSVIESDFWTLPVDYSQMATINPALYQQLSKATIVFFKGDLNYRKLLGEKNWDWTTPFREALQGFHPTKICALRTVKADILCGLEKSVAKKMMASESKKWMENGTFGVIQCSKRVVKL